MKTIKFFLSQEAALPRGIVCQAFQSGFYIEDTGLVDRDNQGKSNAL